MLSKEPVIRLPSNTVQCNLLHLHYICHHMRSDEIEQYLCFMGLDTYNPDLAACYFNGLAGPRLTVIGPDGFPAAAGGYYEIFPGVYNSWMAGTQAGWDTSWRSLTKATRWLMDHLFDQCMARRLQTSVLASRVKTMEWYVKSLKMKPQGQWEGYGRNGEGMSHFARLAPKVEED
jgi:hypothetical protein